MNLKQEQGFSIASAVCGLLSVTMGCCFLSLPIGAMAVLFAVLGSRRNQPVGWGCRIGFYLGMFGCVCGIASLIYLIRFSMQNPAFLQQFTEMYGQFR